MSVFDTEKILDLLVYDSQAPLIFSSGLFLFLFLGFVLIYYLLRNNDNMRIMYVIVFSCLFYYKSSGTYFVLLCIVTAWDFMTAQYIYDETNKRQKKILLFLSVAMNMGLLAYFKYTNLFYELYCNLVDKPFDAFDIFLPVGVSFFTFQSLSYTIDVYRGRLTPLNNFGDYAFFVSFFPQLVAGPIVRAKDFIPQIRKKLHVTREMFGTGIFLITAGLFKKAVISDYISINFVDRIFDNPALYSGVENLFGVYGYALQIYCDFSGYSDMAVGLALLLGLRFNVNFDSPYKSASITEFWRRWHISLSSWLKDYLYISLGGNRKGKIRTYVNLIITMLLGGLWHGASLRFVFWGALHGISLAVHKFVLSKFSSFKTTGRETSRIRRIAGISITFHLVCLGWIFFRAGSFSSASEMIRQIFVSFRPEVFIEMIKGYPVVFAMFATGFALHFASADLEKRVRDFFIEIPLIWKALALVAVIVSVMQIKSSEILPFIYFQF